MTRKLLPVGLLLAGLLLAAMAWVQPAHAASGSSTVGTWRIVDPGPGGWAGGPMLSDGTLGGGGSFTVPVAPGVVEVADIQPVSWDFANSDHTAVDLCVNVIGRQGPIFPIGVPIPFCATVPVERGAPVQLFPGEDTFAKVVLFTS
jgi:hypothetical protein